MVVILDLGDGLEEHEQRAYDDFAAFLRNAGVPKLWTADEIVPDTCKPLPRGVLAWLTEIHASAWDGSSPLQYVDPPTTAEEVQEYLALDPEKVGPRCFWVHVKDAAADRVIGSREVYDPTPAFARARRRVDEILAAASTTTP